jgi:cytidylate kinase
MKKIIVAIDGYSSSGKSTMAKALARRAGYLYIDTGAMYRAIALYALEKGMMDTENIDETALFETIGDISVTFSLQSDGSQHTMLNGRDVESRIRTLGVADAASRISTIGFVRQALVAQQRAMGKEKGIVMDGRDIGTVVFPDAELKVFVTASAETRAQRRFDELIEKGVPEPYEEVLVNVRERDLRDTSRSESPLKQAADAVLIDNSNLTREQQLDLLTQLFDERTSE